MAPDFSVAGGKSKGFGGFQGALGCLLCLALTSVADASWTTKTAVDGVTREPFIVASGFASQSKPVGTTSKGLHVRCKRDKIDVYVDWGHAIDADYGMQARFDRQNALDFSVSEAADPKTASIDLTSQALERFLVLLKESNTLAVRLYDWPGRAVEATFSLAGSNQAIREVERFCNLRQKQKKRELAKENSRYQAEYLATIREAVQRNWVRPAGAPANVKCRVRVKKFPDGEVITAELLNSCGSRALDESVLDAVYQSSPFPKPRDPSLFAREVTFQFSSP